VVLKALLEELQSRREPKRPPRDLIQIIVTALPGLAAFVALIFTWQSINATTDATNHQLNATNHQLRIAEQGQVTDRYNQAITNLGSSSVDVRLGGIYALQRIMQDSPRDQPTVVAVLCAVVRKLHTSSGPNPRSTDIKAALTVVATRDTAHDTSTTVVDFTGAYLAGADLSSLRFSGAQFFGADLTHADLYQANLTRADLTGADLTGAKLTGTKGISTGGSP
jgi:uncharacterized protein YjbI with pentapeptide repeats